MQWREFAAGDPPPKVEFDPDAVAGGDAGADESGTAGGGASGDTVIELTEVTTASDTISFQPLPTGVFASDGQVDRFEMVLKTPAIFTGPDPDGEENAPLIDPQGACMPCVPTP